MSAFLVNGNLLTDGNLIRDMWADHFEAFGTLSENEYFDNVFLSGVVSGVREIFDSCTNIPFGVLCEPLEHPSVTGPLKALLPLFFQTPKKFCMPLIFNFFPSPPHFQMSPVLFLVAPT